MKQADFIPTSASVISSWRVTSAFVFNDGQKHDTFPRAQCKQEHLMHRKWPHKEERGLCGFH